MGVRSSRAGSAADARQNGNVLFAVRPAVRHRLPNHAGAAFELPQKFARACMGNFEPAVHRVLDDEWRGFVAANHTG